MVHISGVDMAYVHSRCWHVTDPTVLTWQMTCHADVVEGCNFANIADELALIDDVTDW